MKHIFSFTLGKYSYPCSVKPHPDEYSCMEEEFPIEWDLFSDKNTILAISQYCVDWEINDVEEGGKPFCDSFAQQYLKKMKDTLFSSMEKIFILGDLSFPSQETVQNIPGEFRTGKIKMWDWDYNDTPFIGVYDCSYWVATEHQFLDEDGIPSVYVMDDDIGGIRPGSPEADEIGYRLCFVVNKEILEKEGKI